MSDIRRDNLEVWRSKQDGGPLRAETSMLGGIAMSRALDLDDLHRLPTVVDVTTAGKALGLSRTRAYELAKRGAFPCRVIRIGESYRVSTAELLRLLGIEPGHPGYVRARSGCSGTRSANR